MLRFIKIFFPIFFAVTINLFAVNYDIIVAKDGSGNYTTIQQALDAIRDSLHKRITIYIKNGIYNEKIFIEKSFITLIGEDRDSTRIIFAELRSNWKKNHDSDYGSAVVNIKDGITDLTLINLTVYNNYGILFKNNDHQFAIRGGGDKIILFNCNIIADGGDTVSLWNTNDGKYYHKNCYFEGYVDYVCPRGFCLIEDCKFYGQNLTASIWHDGSNNKEQKLVIINSFFDGVPGFPLGRFHRDAQFFLIDCRFSKNMANKQIYFKQSDPPRILRWGENRIYFYNCHRDGQDYQWYSDNLNSAMGSPGVKDINAKWVFNNLWDPVSELELICNEINKSN
jgi:pectinesterase